VLSLAQLHRRNCEHKMSAVPRGAGAAQSGSKRKRDVKPTGKGGSAAPDAAVGAPKVRGKSRLQLPDTFLNGVDRLKQKLMDPSSHPQVEVPDGVGGTSLALDFSRLPLKPDAHNRPFWVTPTGSIFLESMCVSIQHVT
jgi:hypothetical protein